MKHLKCEIKDTGYGDTYTDREYVTKWESLYSLYTMAYAPMMEDFTITLDGRHLNQGNTLINVIFLNAQDGRPYIVSRRQGKGIEYAPEYAGTAIDFTTPDTTIKTIQNMVNNWKYPKGTHVLNIILVKDREMFSRISTSDELADYFIIGTELEM